jgi:TatD DNase family protein
MIQRAIEAGVEKFFLPNIDSSSLKGMKELAVKYPLRCFPMMGLHPCSVNEKVEQELELVKKELDEFHYHAVGEIGIDLYWDKSFQAEQEMAFRKQIAWAKEKNLPIVIHCREAFDEILKILDEVNDESLSGIFHCFTGNLEQAKHILGYGNFKLGIGGVVTFKNSGLDKVVSQLKLEDLVLETDSPYLAPTPFRGKRNESSYLLKVAEKLADIYQLSLEEVAEVSTKSALQTFKLHE